MEREVLKDMQSDDSSPEVEEENEGQETQTSGGGNYFEKPVTNLNFISSGCELLDCALGGGYPLGRIVNIVGDKAVGKTLLAIEATANFAEKYPNGRIWYTEVEAAFDTAYSENLGLPVDRVEFPEYNLFTIEDVFEDLKEKVKSLDESTPALYILDSLDALSDKAELERQIDDGSYGTGKPKKLSEMFRRLVQELGKKNVTVIIISQVRDNIGAAFGEKHSRSGGRALDFYASQALWLSNLGQIKMTSSGINRTIGVKIRGKLKKNKISMPFRECDIPLYFAYGLDDVEAHVNFLEQVKRLDEILQGEKDTKRKYMNRLEKMDDDEFNKERENLAQKVRKVWYELESEFMPKRRKYRPRR